MRACIIKKVLETFKFYVIEKIRLYNFLIPYIDSLY